MGEIFNQCEQESETAGNCLVVGNHCIISCPHKKKLTLSLITVLFLVLLHLEMPESSRNQSEMAWNNQSVIREFILQGLSSAWELQIFYFLFFSIVYAATVLGNLLILLTIVSEPRLHSPMYFLLGNLSFIDMSLASFATPKMIADFLSEHKAISFEGCIT